MTLYNPCISAVGPKDAKLLILGEAPGASEEEQGKPFVGSSGYLLDNLLKVAQIERDQCYLTNVLFTRPPGNKLEAFCVKRSDPTAITQMPALSKGLYLKNDFQAELDRLRDELRSVRPNLILALGNTAVWATIGKGAISKIRGTVVDSPYGKVLPTYHPAAIFRQYDLRPIVAADIFKAAREKEYPEIRRPQRLVHINPSLADIEDFIERHAIPAPYLAIDIETSGGQITEVGCATAKDYALVIPFVDRRKPGKSYWATLFDEFKAYKLVQKILLLPQRKIFQNGMFDIQYFLSYRFRIDIRDMEDTMLIHHALHPELLKGLGFLGSVYTDEPAWKLMRTRGEEILKRDDE